jgi:hypothetical protein
MRVFLTLILLCLSSFQSNTFENAVYLDVLTRYCKEVERFYPSVKMVYLEQSYPGDEIATGMIGGIRIVPVKRNEVEQYIIKDRPFYLTRLSPIRLIEAGIRIDVIPFSVEKWEGKVVFANGGGYYCDYTYNSQTHKWEYARQGGTIREMK